MYVYVWLFLVCTCRGQGGHKLHGPGLEDKCEPLHIAAKLSTPMLRKNKMMSSTEPSSLHPLEMCLFNVKQLSAVHISPHSLQKCKTKRTYETPETIT